jgi:hypothetical protein
MFGERVPAGCHVNVSTIRYLATDISMQWIRLSQYILNHNTGRIVVIFILHPLYPLWQCPQYQLGRPSELWNRSIFAAEEETSHSPVWLTM